MQWTSRNLAETEALAAGLARSLGGQGGVVGLSGPLGAGKTAFAKALASALGIDPGALASPTFVIAGELPLPPDIAIERLVHADFYRVEDPLELEMAGLADWLAPGTLLLAEWADRFPEDLPADRLEVRIDRAGGPGAGELGPEERAITAQALGGPGSTAEAVLERWSQQCP